MKSIMVIVLAFALGLECFSQQKGLPIASYNENGYTISEVKQFALLNTELSHNWRNELLLIVNAGLLDAGENLILNETSINWILNQISYEEVKLESFINSRKFGNKIIFFQDVNFRGTVGIFKYGKCKLILFKTICLNLLKVPIQVVEQFTVVQQEDPLYISTNDNKGVMINVNCNCPSREQYQQSGAIRTGMTFIPYEPYYQPQYYGGYYGGVNYSHTSYYQPQNYGVDYYSNYSNSNRGNYSRPAYNNGGPRGVPGNGYNGSPSGVPGNRSNGSPSGVPGNRSNGSPSG
ncbi:MAG: hypothetical protein AAB493_02380, partial [Patescibacteria group bacterium]